MGTDEQSVFCVVLVSAVHTCRTLPFPYTLDVSHEAPMPGEAPRPVEVDLPEVSLHPRGDFLYYTPRPCRFCGFPPFLLPLGHGMPSLLFRVVPEQCFLPVCRLPLFGQKTKRNCPRHHHQALIRNRTVRAANPL
jgi:hypothetical protein